MKQEEKDEVKQKVRIVQSFQFTKGGYTPDWFIVELKMGRAWYQGGENPYITIETPDGEKRAYWNDWIIKDTDSNCYPLTEEQYINF